MPYIPPEVVAQAREMDLLTYLKNYEPQELVHFGGNTYCTREHDSLKISNGKWCWFSRGIGGYSALDYLIKVKEMPFLQAVETIMENLSAAPPAFVPAPKTPKEKALLLPQANRSATHAVEYLHRRGIDYELIDFCIQTGRLYESYPYHNVVFVGMDTDGKPRYANQRGIGSDFIGDANGSDKHYSFGIPAAVASDTLHLFESAVDLLSYGTPQKLDGKDWPAKTCSPSLGSTSQGRKSRKAVCPLRWCGILPSIHISAVWCCGSTTTPRDGSPPKPSRPCCRESMRSRWTFSRHRRARTTTTAYVCGWDCPSLSAEKGAKNGERLYESGTAHPALSYAERYDAKNAGHRRRLFARNRRHPHCSV